MAPTVEDRVYRVVSEVLGVPLEDVNDNTSPDTTVEWDSESHVNLILALESEFGVVLTPDDAMDMLSVKLIRMILADQGVGVDR